jgi:hypothetical protein
MLGAFNFVGIMVLADPGDLRKVGRLMKGTEERTFMYLVVGVNPCCQERGSES